MQFSQWLKRHNLRQLITSKSNCLLKTFRREIKRYDKRGSIRCSGSVLLTPNDDKFHKTGEQTLLDNGVSRRKNWWSARWTKVPPIPLISPWIEVRYIYSMYRNNMKNPCVSLALIKQLTSVKEENQVALLQLQLKSVRRAITVENNNKLNRS